MSHNIDLHAVTGALGGGGLTLVTPGEQATIRFKATKPGVFVYHCAPGGAMIPYHVVTGMNGAIMVLPRDGLKDAKGKSAALRPRLLHRRAGLLRSEGQRREVQELRHPRLRPCPTRSR